MPLVGLSAIQAKQKLPNIIVIYADDMGYGDLNCQNPNSKIPTPNLDKLASEGVRFTDAHSSSGISSPSRFALLTGKYHWRRQHDIVSAFGKPFFKDSDLTIAQLLKTKNYKTACIGKWHLGWNWEYKNSSAPKNRAIQINDIDWSKPVKGGPLDRGFDYYFGDGTINFPPYAWVENDKLIEAPNDFMKSNDIGFKVKEGHWEFRPGPKMKNWNPYKVLPTLTDKTVEYIDNQEKDQPFFLYFALPSPHAPIIPNEEFEGKSKAGAYGDFMFQTDWVIGQVLKKLKEKGLEENTVIIFSADNGPELYAFARGEKYDHFSSGQFRGLKRDVWEGGHHVPMIIKYPNIVKAGSVSNETIAQVDMFATIANITGIKIPKNAAPDSYNFLPILKGQAYASPYREATVHNTFSNKWGLRKGDWLFINNASGSHTNMPESYKKLRGYKDFKTPELLFNLKVDPEQKINLSEKFPEKIKEMKKILKRYRTSGKSISRY
jgi:arylsulfatase A-like enzyme